MKFPTFGQRVEVVNKVKTDIDLKTGAMILFVWLKVGGAIKLSWWWILLALLA